VVRVPVDLLKRIERSVEKVHERMLRTARVLEQASIPFAVVGGNAVAIWVESIDEGAGRNTRDVDILLERKDLPRAIEAMHGAGFDNVEVHGVWMFVDRADPHPSRAVHVMFAGEKVRPSQEYPAPGIANIKRGPEGVPAIGLIELLTMKLQALRNIDRAHIVDMIHVGLIDDAMVAQIPQDLRPRLEEILANPDG